MTRTMLPICYKESMIRKYCNRNCKNKLLRKVNGKYKMRFVKRLQNYCYKIKIRKLFNPKLWIILFRDIITSHGSISYTKHHIHIISSYTRLRTLDCAYLILLLPWCHIRQHSHLLFYNLQVILQSIL